MTAARTPTLDQAALGAAIVAWARTQIGVRWEHQGRIPRSAGTTTSGGMDCVGLPICCGRALLLPVVDMVEYSEVPTPSQLLGCLQANCDRVEPEADFGEAGILLALWIRRQSLPCHVAISNGEGGIIHAQRWRGGGCVVEESLRDSFWEKRVHSGWRYRG